MLMAFWYTEGKYYTVPTGSLDLLLEILQNSDIGSTVSSTFLLVIRMAGYFFAGYPLISIC